MYPQAVLSFTLPNGEKRAVALRPNEPVLIGRNRASTIKLNLPSVSRQHARIMYERDVFWIEDLGSSNGTFVNQKQIQKARINIGDVLKCGDFVIAVRNRTDRTSIPPLTHTQDESKPSDPPILDRRVTMGQRRDSLKPSQQTNGGSSLNPWHSKAPTHGPEESVIRQNSSSVPSANGRISRSPRHSGPPSASPRTEGLSTAYSDTKLRETERRRIQSDHPTAALVKTGTSANSGMQTSEEDTTELMRLRIVEQQLLDEVNFQSNQIETLQKQRQEASERIVSLESDLDHGAQQFEQLRQSMTEADRKTEQSLQTALEEVDALKLQNKSIEQEILTMRERTRGDQADLVKEIKSLENENQSLRVDLEEVINDSAEADLIDEIEMLRAENIKLKSNIENHRGATEVHVFSLPRPNYNSTHPNWAKLQAKYQQVVEELIYLKRTRSTSRVVNTNQPIRSPDENITSTHERSGLIDRQNRVEVDDKEPEIEIKEKLIPSAEATSAEEPQANSLTNTRRAWRGML
jgi:pSer/pThr/pTyr-binding forkhead associated (FHA) protein